MQAKRSSSTKCKGSVCLEQVLFHAAGNYPNTIGKALMCLYSVQMRCVEFFCLHYAYAYYLRLEIRLRGNLGHL